LTNTIPATANIGNTSGTVGLKIQLSSDNTGSYVPVVVLDTETAISIGAVSQEGTWVVTADAGADLNTSALALEDGGNLATIATAQGAGGTGINQPTGGIGLLGWLSGIYKAITGTLTVSGTVTANAGTNTSTAALALESGGNLATLAGTVSAGKVLVTPVQAMASSLNATVVGTGTFAIQQPDQVSSGSINSATANATYVVNLANGEGIVGFEVAGLTASGATLTIEAQIGSASPWNPTNGFASSTGTVFTTLTTDQGFRVNVGGRTAIRLRVSSTGIGTIAVASSAASVSDLVGISSPLPAGSNIIGGILAAATPSSSFAVTPGSSSVLETSHVLKASAGNLYSLNVTTSTASGFLMTFNAMTVPADGTVAPVYCIPVPAGSAVSMSFEGSPPDCYSTGIVAVFSTTGPFTKTSSATAFFTWRVQ
jgi:hypothetical protein